MRVVMLSWEYPPRIVGGISPHVFELSRNLARLGLEIHVVTKTTPGAPDDVIEPSGVYVHRVHLPKEPHNFVHEIQLLNIATDSRVRRLLEDWRPGGQPTVFHAHDWLSLDAARELKYEYQLPMIATVHAMEEGRNRGIHNDLQRYIHEQEYWLTYEAWRVIVCSRYMKNEVMRAFDCPSDKIDVVYNGVDSNPFTFSWPEHERQRKRLQYAQPQEKIVLYVGRFVREKGIHLLLNAASAILCQQPQTKFLIVGGGHREKLERFVRWFGLEDRVIFTGFMSNRALHELYRIADAAVFPSLYEPFGIVALEAMASGVPVVSSDAGGLSEVVLHDVTGTLSFAGDGDSVAWAVLRVLNDRQRAARLTEAATRRLHEEFDWSKLAAQTQRIYDRVWAEFLQSHWADQTLWPVTSGADERAKRLGVREKALAASSIERPMRQTNVPLPAESASVDEALKISAMEDED